MKKILQGLAVAMMIAVAAVSVYPMGTYAQSSGKATVFNTSTGQKLVINVGEVIPAGFRLMTNPVLITIINSSTGEKRVIQAGEAIPAGFVVFTPAPAPRVVTTPAATTTVTPVSTGSSLGDLIILDKLFNNNSGILGGGGIGGNDNDLGNLFMLNQLFGGGTSIFGNGIVNGTNNLGNLFLLQELFGGDSVFDGGSKDLGDLFVLDQLFGGSSNGLFR